VTFKDGANVLGTSTLDGAGQATFSTAALTVGSHAITAAYAGNAEFTPSTSNGVTQIVNKAQTTTSLASSRNPSPPGQAVTFTAAVSVVAPGAGTPTGTVIFRDGTTVLGTGTLNASGQASFSSSILTLGNHSLTAEYTGNTNFSGSSATLTQTIANYIRGDANSDGLVNMGDVTKTELIILGLAQSAPGADANGDGFVNMGDVTRIELIILGLVS
jgi:hypothetical protein